MLFFFNDTATPEIYTLSLHDALPILDRFPPGREHIGDPAALKAPRLRVDGHEDRKSTRLNSSHANTSYAVFCLKKKIGLHRDDAQQRANEDAPLMPGYV